jgi:methylphosphotriester-DNA--protein-cysteine methyltransferase
MMIKHNDITAAVLFKNIKNSTIRFAGNSALKIYGSLHCKSGRRMKKANRIFFSSETAAVENGYRPCGHCMKYKYAAWKKLQMQ